MPKVSIVQPWPASDPGKVDKITYQETASSTHPKGQSNTSIVTKLPGAK